MAPKFTAPEPFTGTFAGIEFENGVGTADVDEAATAVLVAHGYTVEASAPEGDPTDKWTVDQLKTYAEGNDITVSGNKGEVLKTITDTLTERKAEADKVAADEAAKAAAGDSQPATGDAS